MTSIDTSKMNSVLIAPKSYNFITPENAQVGSHLGNSSNSLREIPPNAGENAQSGQQVVWNTAFPDGLVDSTPKLRCEMEITLTAVAGATADDIRNNLTQRFGVASFPLNRCIQTGTADINGQAFTTPVAQNVDVVAYSSNPHNLALISQASERDEYDQFSTAILTDPLQSGANASDATKSRGLGANYEVVSVDAVANPGDPRTGNNNTATVRIVLEEALMMEPFQYHDMTAPQPFKDINRFVLTLNLVSDLARSAINLNSVAVQPPFVPGGEAPPVPRAFGVSVSSTKWSLLARSYNPSVVQTIPPSLVYNSHQINLVSSVPVQTNAPDSQIITFPATILNGVPSMFAIYVERPRADFGPRTFLPISRASLDMDNKTALLSTLTPFELYQVSVNNGYNMRYATYLGTSASPTSPALSGVRGAGSFLFVRPSDLGLNEGTISNASKTLQIRAEITVGTMVVGERCVARLVAIEDNFVQDNNGTWTSIRPLVPAEKLLSSSIVYSGESRVSNHIIGGSWFTNALRSAWGTLKDLVRSDAAKMAARNLRNAGPFRDYVGDSTALGRVAQTFGYGHAHAQKNKRVSKKGGDLVRLGGKKLTKADLKRMLEA